MSTSNKHKENSKEDKQFNSIKKLLKDKNLNPKKTKDLKELLSLNLDPKIKILNFENFITFLLQYLNSKNKSIFYEFLFKSCELGKLKNVKKLLDHGLNVNCQNNIGETPLHIAIAKNDIKLIKLLIKFEPDTSLSTTQDCLTPIDYAEIRGNENIIKIINELNEENKKKMIKSEIFDFINKDMNKINNIGIEDMSSFIKKNNDFEEIQNYNGEKMSIFENEESSNSITNNNKNNNVNKINLTKLKNVNEDINNTIIQTMLNESDLRECLSPKNSVKINNYSNNLNQINNNCAINDEAHKRFLSEDHFFDTKMSKKYSSELKYFPSPIKKKEDILNYCFRRSFNPSCVQSVTTCHTINKEQFESPLINDKVSKSIGKKNELLNFMNEINLPKNYVDILLDNGFDDLEFLILQSKNEIAISDQNLKDIGINSAGDRSKILIHLEELAGNFPFSLEKEIIYSNKYDEEKNCSLLRFLISIKSEKYLQTFKENGYYNAELLFTQMASKQPITEDILKKEFGINKVMHAKRIILNLESCSDIYINSLKNNIGTKNCKSLVLEGNPQLKTCGACLIF